SGSLLSPCTLDLCRTPPRATLFRYTTLFRSLLADSLPVRDVLGEVDFVDVPDPLDRELVLPVHGPLDHRPREVEAPDDGQGAHEIGRAHVLTPVTDQSRMPSSA